MVKFFGKRPNKLTLVSAAAYLFMFAVCAKGVFLYATQHPPIDHLLIVHGNIRGVHLGGQGKSTSLEIESENGTYRYLTYYGKVWPGMMRLRPGEQVDLLAERNRLDKNEFIEGKSYYIWELIYQQQIIIPYEDVREMLRSEEAVVNHLVNIWLAVSAVFLLFALIRKSFLGRVR